MKAFFKFLLASILGVGIALTLFTLIAFAFIASFSKEQEVEIKDHSVLTLTLDYPIQERTINNPFENVLFGGINKKTIGLTDILERIEWAKSDPKIKGIYLDASMVSANFASLEAIRNALLDFKTSEKFIVAYSEIFTQGAYYLASTADKIYMNPEGVFSFQGLSSTSIFFKGALDKLGIDAQVIKVGTYKSAVEPFILDKMSEANREQTAALLQSIYGHYLDGISQSRDIPVDRLQEIADQYLVSDVESAQAHGLVDEAKYKDEVLESLNANLGEDIDADINAISIEAYHYKPASESSSRDRIAVVYAVGDIISGEGDDMQIGSERISRELRKVRKDDKVKAVVFRINSPGGSALASDVIWREVELIKQVKPIIVSMGDVAASGGYYIACAADSIFAEPTTITGSIGVFGIIPNFQEFLNDRIGVTTDVVKTGKFSDFGDVSRALSSEEEALIQREINQIYETFTTKVASGRNLSPHYVDSIGQGRVWSGVQGMELGLVDGLGGLDVAIEAAANKAGIDAYKLVQYPSISSPFETLLNTSSDQITAWYAKSRLGAAYPYYEQMERAVKQTGILMRMPYSLEIH